LRLLLLQVMERGLEGTGHDGLVGLVELDEGHAHASPSSLDRREDVGLVGYKGGLLIEGEFENAAALLLAGEGGEDVVVEAEVGVVHVRAFDGSGELEGEAAEEGYMRVCFHLSLSFLSFGGPPPPLPGGKPFCFIDLRVVAPCKFVQIKELSLNLGKQRSYASKAGWKACLFSTVLSIANWS